MVRQSAHDVVAEAYDQLRDLKPTIEEISELAEEHSSVWGVVTYSRSKGGSLHFLRYHDKNEEEFGGTIHIDVRFVDPEVHNRRVPDTTHLMLDQYHAPIFVYFIKIKRGIK